MSFCLNTKTHIDRQRHYCTLKLLSWITIAQTFKITDTSLTAAKVCIIGTSASVHKFICVGFPIPIVISDGQWPQPAAAQPGTLLPCSAVLISTLLQRILVTVYPFLGDQVDIGCNRPRAKDTRRCRFGGIRDNGMKKRREREEPCHICQHYHDVSFSLHRRGPWDGQGPSCKPC